MNDSIQLGTLTVRPFISGSNPLCGFSHKSPKIDREMADYFTFERSVQYLHDCERAGIDAIVTRIDRLTLQLFKEFWKDGGRIKWIGQTASEYVSLIRNISEALDGGVSAVFIHGGMIDRLLQEGDYRSIQDALVYVKSKSHIPIGVAAHNPNSLLQLQELNYDYDFNLLSLYNISGYHGKLHNRTEIFDDSDREKALTVVPELSKPCLLYKILGAGRKTLNQGLSDLAGSFRQTDGVVVGMYTKEYLSLIRSNVDEFYQWRSKLYDGR